MRITNGIYLNAGGGGGEEVKFAPGHRAEGRKRVGHWYRYRGGWTRCTAMEIQGTRIHYVEIIFSSSGPGVTRAHR